MKNIDHQDLADDLAALRARLAELGPDTVRVMLSAGAFPTNHTVAILKWLTDPDNPGPESEHAA